MYGLKTEPFKAAEAGVPIIRMTGPFDVKKPADLVQWAEDMVCPVCFAPLRFSDAAVVCNGCGRSYPVVDGIPVLIAERATLKNS
jgi:uncharacterized protein